MQCPFVHTHGFGIFGGWRRSVWFDWVVENRGPDGSVIGMPSTGCCSIGAGGTAVDFVGSSTTDYVVGASMKCPFDLSHRPVVSAFSYITTRGVLSCSERDY